MITEETRILQARAGGIPEEMKQARRWVCWAAVPKTRRDGTVQFTKEPRRADEPSRKASSTDPSTWSDFTTAMAAVQDGKATGIGFVLGDGWAGIDIDNSIAGDPPSVTASPKTEDWARLRMVSGSSAVPLASAAATMRSKRLLAMP